MVHLIVSRTGAGSDQIDLCSVKSQLAAQKIFNRKFVDGKYINILYVAPPLVTGAGSDLLTLQNSHF